jgi:hypothetical protein
MTSRGSETPMSISKLEFGAVSYHILSLYVGSGRPLSYDIIYHMISYDISYDSRAGEYDISYDMSHHR